MRSPLTGLIPIPRHINGISRHMCASPPFVFRPINPLADTSSSAQAAATLRIRVRPTIARLMSLLSQRVNCCLPLRRVGCLIQVAQFGQGRFVSRRVVAVEHVANSEREVGLGGQVHPISVHSFLRGVEILNGLLEPSRLVGREVD